MVKGTHDRHFNAYAEIWKDTIEAYISIALVVGFISSILIMKYMRQLSRRFPMLSQIPANLAASGGISCYSFVMFFVGISDFGVVIFFILRYWIDECFYYNVTENLFTCKTADAFGLVSVTTSVWLITLLSVERCLFMVKQDRYLALFKKDIIMKYFIFVLILDGLIFSLCISSYQYVIDTSSNTTKWHCKATKVFHATVRISAFIVAFIPTMIIGLNVLLILNRYRKLRRSPSSESNLTESFGNTKAFIGYAICYCACLVFYSGFELYCFDKKLSVDLHYNQCKGISHSVYHVIHVLSLTGAQTGFLFHFFLSPYYRFVVCGCMQRQEMTPSPFLVEGRKSFRVSAYDMKPPSLAELATKRNRAF